SDEDVHALVADAGAGEHLEQGLEATGDVARLLFELAGGADDGGLARLEGAGGQLEQLAVDGDPLVLDEHEAPVVEQRQDHGDARVDHDVSGQVLALTQDRALLYIELRGLED